MTVDAAATTTSTTTFAQVNAATPQTQQSGRSRPGGDTTAPTVSLTAPATSATVSGTVTLTANASDNVGVAGVQFMRGRRQLWAPRTPPRPTACCGTPPRPANGSHTLTAVARDAAGNNTTSAAVSVTVDNPDTKAPTVSLTAPANGATVSGTVTLTATASDNVGVAGVQFLVDGTTLGAEDTTSPYGVSWNTTTATNGTHTLTAVARDAAGNTTTSTTVTVTVDNRPAPAVSFTAPANGATVSGTVTLSATATDNAGGSGVAGVQFKLDGANLGAEDTTSPYSVSWNTTAVTNGTHTLTALARDAAGNTTTSTAVTVTVANAVGTTTSINVGSDPNGVAIVGNRAYVANGASDTVSVIDVNTQQILATIPLGHTPTYVVANPDGERAYVSNRDSNSVSIISTATNWVTHTIAVGSRPQGVAVSADGSRVYVSNSGSNSVSVIDAATNSVVATYSTGASPNGLAVTSDGKLYVANRDNNTVSVLHAANGTVAAGPIAVGSLPTGVAVNPAGTRVYVTNASGTVSVISTANNSVMATVPVGSAPVGVSVSPDGGLVYVADSSDSLSVIDAATNTRIQQVAIDTSPENGVHFVAVSPDGTSVYVTDQADRVVRMFSLANHAPAATGFPTFGAANVDTGAVVGSLRVVDPDGNPLTYTVAGSPSSGSVAIDAATGNYTYIPNQAARLAATDTHTVHTDTFTVIVSDGQASTNVTVTVPISSAPPWVNPTPVALSGSGAAGVAVADIRGYVANQATNSVSMISLGDSGYADEISRIAVGNAPTALAINPAKSRLYVTNRDSDSVSVIALTWQEGPGTVIKTIQVGSKPTSVAVSLDNSRVYIGNSGNNTVSVIDANSNTVIGVFNTGSSPSALAINSAGTNLYVANRGNNAISVLNASTGAVIGGPITVGGGPNAIALNPAGTRLYVTNASGTVSVINTGNNSVLATVGVGSTPVGVSVSPDGTLVYVGNSDDSLSIIDANTNTRIRHLTLDANPENGVHYVAVSTDGKRAYVTDQADNTLRMVSWINNPPRADFPTAGLPDPTTGVVTGSVGAYDWPEGDALYYSVTRAPRSGTLTLDPSTGAFIYTPSASARAAGGLDSFTVAVSDGRDVISVEDSTWKTTTVTVPIRYVEHPSTQTTIEAGYGPTDVAVGGTRAYVAGSYDLTAIDTTTNQPVATAYLYGVAVGPVLATPNGNRVYMVEFSDIWNDPYSQVVIAYDGTTLARVGDPLAGNRRGWQSALTARGCTSDSQVERSSSSTRLLTPQSTPSP